MALKGSWPRIIIAILICSLILIGVVTVLVKFVFLKPTEPNDGITTTITIATTTKTTTTNGIVGCITACEIYQTCINHICTTDGELVISLSWSRIGDGDLIVRTPPGKTISRNNKGPSNNTDQGQFAAEVTSGTGSEEIFWSTDIRPPTGTYYICAEPYNFVPAISIKSRVTFTVQVRTPPSKIKTFTKNITSSSTNNLACSPTSNTLVAIFVYP